MEDDSRAGSAIIPEDQSKQLTLPLEMIHRGLELAVRIEQKQGIQPFPENPTRKEYMVRCHLAIMEWVQEVGRSPRLSGSDKSITQAPVYLVLSIDKDGLHISCASTSKNRNLVGIEGNEDRYRLLNAFNNLNPFTIPFPSFDLFYKLVHPMDEKLLSSIGLSSRIPKEELKNFTFEIGPQGVPGSKGPVTKEANPFLNINRDCVKIVIIYESMLGDPNLKQGLVAKDPPLQLAFIVIDPKGEDDPVASREFYHAILKAKNPLA
jgi:hypothetical protein